MHSKFRSNNEQGFPDNNVGCSRVSVPRPGYDTLRTNLGKVPPLISYASSLQTSGPFRLKFLNVRPWTCDVVKFQNRPPENTAVTSLILAIRFAVWIKLKLSTQQEKRYQNAIITFTTGETSPARTLTKSTVREDALPYIRRPRRHGDSIGLRGSSSRKNHSGAKYTVL